MDVERAADGCAYVNLASNNRTQWQLQVNFTSANGSSILSIQL